MPTIPEFDKEGFRAFVESDGRILAAVLHNFAGNSGTVVALVETLPGCLETVTDSSAAWGADLLQSNIVALEALIRDLPGIERLLMATATRLSHEAIRLRAQALRAQGGHER